MALPTLWLSLVFSVFIYTHLTHSRTAARQAFTWEALSEEMNTAVITKLVTCQPAFKRAYHSLS